MPGNSDIRHGGGLCFWRRGVSAQNLGAERLGIIFPSFRNEREVCRGLFRDSEQIMETTVWGFRG